MENHQNYRGELDIFTLSGLARHLPVQPRHDERHQSVKFGGHQRAAFRDAVPLGDATTTASRRGVLCRKHRMAAVRGLLAILWRVGNTHARREEFVRVAANDGAALLHEIITVSGSQAKAAAKLRLTKSP